jgi:hypothetical protein
LKIVVWGLCAVFTALFSACPPYLPEKVQIRTEPAIYLPLGTPDSIQDNLDFPINDLATGGMSFSAGGNNEIASYDYLGYGDTRAFIISLKLAEINLKADLFPEAAPQVLSGMSNEVKPFGTLDFSPTTPQKEITGDTGDGFDLSGMQNILYDGLKFRSIPVYLYVSGPSRIFTKDNGDKDNVTVSVSAFDKDNENKPLKEGSNEAGVVLLSGAPVTPQEFPDFPESENDSMKELPSPRPETFFYLTDILNLDNPPKSLKFKYTINIGSITVKLSDLPNVKDDFEKNPLSVMLVVLLPLQFDVTKDVPILSEKNDDPDAKAIHFLEEGQDLFGRVSEDDEGSASMKDILEMLRSLRIDINIENNIGFAGYAPIYKGKPDTADEEKIRLGKISLSGLSSVSLSRSEIAYPLNIWIEMYLKEGQGFEIKRLPDDTDELPLKLSLSITVETHIDKTF